MNIDNPKRPLSPFFLFFKQLRTEGQSLSPESASKLWKELTQEQRQSYIDQYRQAKTLYDEHIKKLRVSKTKVRPAFRMSRIRTLIGSTSEVIAVKACIPQALSRILVCWSNV